jgi:hypothetical protein
MKWSTQGNAVIGTLTLTDGRGGNAVIMGAASNPKGAVIVAKNADSGEPETLPLIQGLDTLNPTDAIDILCMQERLHGERGLTPPTDF